MSIYNEVSKTISKLYILIGRMYSENEECAEQIYELLDRIEEMLEY